MSRHSPPLLTHKFGGDTLRKVATDKAEARKIALYGLTWGYKFVPSVEDEPTRVMLKAVSRQYAFFTKQKTAQRNHLHALSERTFPGGQQLFTSDDRRRVAADNWVQSNLPLATRRCSMFRNASTYA